MQLLRSCQAKSYSEVRTQGSQLSSPARIYDEDFLPLNSACTRGGPFDYPKCEPGLWCLGNNRPLCKRRSKTGEECGSEYKVCGRKDTCNSANRCVPNPSFDLHYRKLDEDCGPDIVKRCKPGLWCIVGKCRKKVRCGEACGLETQVCRPGLECRTIHPTKKKICARILGKHEAVLQEGEKCKRRKGPRCRTGLRCCRQNRQEMERRCRVPKRLGEPCIPRLGQCEFGRRCMGQPPNLARCVQPQRLGERCGELHVVCRGIGAYCNFQTKTCMKISSVQ